MRKNRSKMRKVLPLVLGLTLGSAGYMGAEGINDSFFNRTGDFIFVTQYMHKLDRKEKTSIDSLLRGGNITRIYAIDPVEGINSRIRFLGSERAKEFYSEEERRDLIGRYKSFLNEICKEKRNPNYKKSLENLSKAVMDGEIEPKELEDVEAGTYMVVKEGIDKEKGVYSVFALARIGEKSEALPSEKETPKSSIKAPEKIIPEEQQLPLPEPPKETEKENYTQLSLITEADSNFAFNTFGGTVGLRVAPFRNKKIGLGALLDANFSLDKTIDSYTDVLTDRLSTAGSVTDTNIFSIGGSLEMQYGPLFLGGGIDYKSWIRESIAKIIKDGQITDSNSDSTPNRQVFGKIYGGAEFPIGNVWKLGATVGYDGGKGAYFGLRNTFRLNSGKEKRIKK
jgi:hypothetical protein